MRAGGVEMPALRFLNFSSGTNRLAIDEPGDDRRFFPDGP
jgi:hypothetical protein